MNLTVSSATVLSDLAVIEVTGDEAATFLQGQLSNDVEAIQADSSLLAAYCTPKGRMLASMIMWKTTTPEPGYRALVKESLAQAFVKRLSMFVLRAKVKIRIVPVPVFGLTLNQTTETPDILPTVPYISGLNLSALTEATAQNQVVVQPNGVCIAAPTTQAETARWWFVPNENTEAQVEPDTHAQAQWQMADIMGGLPWVEQATQETFIPQTLNFDLINGVNFTKGCYPGQEIVARSHYRGTVKRRMARGVANVPAEEVETLAGQDIFNANGARPENAAGRVVNAARSGTQTHLLLEVKLADISQAQYRLGQPEGPEISLEPLPYTIQDA